MSDPERPERSESPGLAKPAPDAAVPPPEPASDAAAPPAHASGTDAPASPAPSLQEMAVRSALASVMDPELGLSVIDLGLIREVQILPDCTRVRMLLTTPFCPYAPQLMEEVRQATTSVVPLPCEVDLLPDPWSPDLMPDPGLLGFAF